MKKSLLLFLLILMSSLYPLYGSEEKKIYFEGIVESESAWDGIASITLQITDGELKGKSILIYFSTNFEDNNTIDCKCNATFFGDIESTGRKVKGIITESKGNFEDYEKGGFQIRKIYRPLELDWV